MKKTLTNIGLICLSLVTCIVFTEVALRVIVPEHRSKGRLYQFEWNRDFHKSPMMPNVEVIHQGIPLKTNSFGLKDKEYLVEKSGNVYRILLFGDSFTFGQMLPNNYTLPKQIERKLNDVSEDSIEVINFGVCGLNTFQEMMFYSQFGQKFNPDMVVLVWCTGDNALNGYRLADLDYFLEYQTIRRINKRTDGSVVLGHAVVEGKNKSVQVNAKIEKKDSLQSKMYRFFRKELERFYIVNVFGGRIRNLFFKLGLNISVWEQEAFFDTNREGFKLCFNSIKEMDRLCRYTGRRFVVIIYPRMQLLNKDYYNERLYKKVEKFCNENDIICLNMFDSFRGRNQGKLRVALNDCHPSKLANDIASDTVAHFIEPFITRSLIKNSQ